MARRKGEFWNGGIIAYGFAQFGEPERAASATATARAVLTPTEDDVHRFLFDAYVARAARYKIAGTATSRIAAVATP